MDSITKIFKALFSGIGNFFKILVDGILGAFSGPTVDVLGKDTGSAEAPAANAEPSFRSGAAPVAVSAPSAPAPTATPAAPEATPSAPAEEAAVAVANDGPVEIVELPRPMGDVQFASLNDLKAAERPKRRPGAALSPFKAMVRDMQASKS